MEITENKCFQCLKDCRWQHCVLKRSHIPNHCVDVTFVMLYPVWVQRLPPRVMFNDLAAE